MKNVIIFLVLFGLAACDDTDIDTDTAVETDTDTAVETDTDTAVETDAGIDKVADPCALICDENAEPGTFDCVWPLPGTPCDGGECDGAGNCIEN